MLAVLLFVDTVLDSLTHLFDVFMIEVANLHFAVQLLGVLTCLKVPLFSLLLVQLPQGWLVVVVECLWQLHCLADCLFRLPTVH